MAPNFVDTGDSTLDIKIREYLTWNNVSNIGLNFCYQQVLSGGFIETCLFQDEKGEKEIQALIEQEDVKTLSNLFLKRLEFGTAGLRGRMGPGYNQMNDLVIIQTGQGLAKYLIKTIPDVKEKGIILGYDGRYNSKR